MTPFINMTKINASRGEKTFFVNEWSPESIGLKDPFSEKFSELWNFTDNKGKDDKVWRCPYKKIALTLNRGQRFIANIKVIKDPLNPGNEGKIFLYDMSPTMMDIVKAALRPSESEIALGSKPMNIFDPMEGHNFLIKAKMGTNNFITYGDSKFDGNKTAVYTTEEEAIQDIKTNSHNLSEFLKPEFYKSFDELAQLRDKFLSKDKRYTDLFPESGSTSAGTVIPSAELDAVVEAVVEAVVAPVTPVIPEPVAEPVKPVPVASKVAPSDDDLDLLLASL